MTTTTERAVLAAVGHGYDQVHPYDVETDPGSIVLPLAVDGEADLILATDERDDLYDVMAEWYSWSRAEGPSGFERQVATNLTLHEALRFADWFCAAQVRANERAEREMDETYAAAGDDLDRFDHLAAGDGSAQAYFTERAL